MFLTVLFAALASDDRELIERLQRRDQQAMADLYDRYGRLTYALIFRIVRDGGIAEDLTQETFLRIWTRIPVFDREKGALGAWVMTVARNRAIDYVRSVQGRMRDRSVELDSSENPALFTTIEANILNTDRARRLKQAFGSLNENQRIVIELAYFEGLSQADMAERMKQPLGTVKTWCRTALIKLREELGEALTV
ncbi:MAG TPA: sigma-70 family RNA polymerase sigma factor [Bryobacteraceae bacterium]|nr:sigma-70 family RNA polymerase sigma factor [Bryobacteraceae bacterium]